MIDLKNAMICWCSADRWPEWKSLCEKDGTLPPNAARVMVVEHMGADARSADYLPSSWGADAGYWRTISDQQRGAEMLMMFNTLVTQEGLTVAEVHTAFMNIREYAVFHGEERLVYVSGSGATLCAN